MSDIEKTTLDALLKNYLSALSESARELAKQGRIDPNMPMTLMMLRFAFPEQFKPGTAEDKAWNNLLRMYSLSMMQQQLKPTTQEIPELKKISEKVDKLAKKVEEKEKKDVVDTYLERQAKLALIRQMQPQYPFMPSLEPALDKDGQPLRDAEGNIVYKVSYTPFPTKPTTVSIEPAVKLTEKILEIETKRREEAEKEAREMRKKMLEDYDQRIAVLESKTSEETLLNRLKKYKDLGLIQIGGTTTTIPPEVQLKIEEMRTGLEKFKTEQTIDLEKWKTEQLMKAEERKESRELTRQLISAGEKVGTQILKPVAEAVGEGIKSGKIGVSATQPSQQVTGKTIDLSKLSEDELKSLAQRAERDIAFIQQQKELILEELAKRKK